MLTRKAVITGGCGFIGEALKRVLTAQGYELLVLDSLVGGARPVLADSTRIVHVPKDLVDVGPAELAGFRGASWVHLAALPFIPDSFRDPECVYDHNVKTTRAAVGLAMQTGARRFVYASSAEIYGCVRGESILRENCPVQPVSRYACSKAESERIVSDALGRGLPSLVLRLFNAYGSDATHPYFIPEMIRQCGTEAEIRVGNLDTVRDFTFVDDTAEAIRSALEIQGNEGAIVNVGSGRGLRMAEVLHLIRDKMGASGKPIVRDPRRLRPKNLDPPYLVSNTERAEAILHWRASVPFEVGLVRTIEAFRSSGGWRYSTVPADTGGAAVGPEGGSHQQTRRARP